MDRKTFIGIGEALYGKTVWKSALARRLGKSRSTIYRMADGAPIDETTVLALQTLQAERIREIEGLASVPPVNPPNEGVARGPSHLPVDGPPALSR